MNLGREPSRRQAIKHKHDGASSSSTSDDEAASAGADDHGRQTNPSGTSKHQMAEHFKNELELLQIHVSSAVENGTPQPSC